MEIARVFLNTFMGYSFQGLKQIMLDSKMKPDEVGNKKFVIFINRPMTAFKMLVGPNHIIYHNNGRHRIPLESITHFPEFFDGKRINVTGAIKKTIEAKLVEGQKPKN